MSIIPIASTDGEESDLSASTSSSEQWSQPCQHFAFAEILAATENFDGSLVIGSGGFGKVYKGNVMNESSSVVAAIKRLDAMSNQGETEFWAEVEMLSKLRHCHLVSLIGYCNHEKEKILVYEYMPNGTLEDHLHKLRTPLTWLQRLKICIGAGRGLHYLHTGTGIEFGIIHRDVKSSNILLHESWAAKISDFGLSRIGPTNQPSTYVNTLVKGTFGYLDPNYFTTGRLTRKSDVYAFGVVLLEVLCRKRAVDKTLDEEQWGLATWAQDFIKEGNFKHIVDSELRGQISQRSLKEFLQIAGRCLHNNPKKRPTMAEIVVSLESLLIVKEKTNSSLQTKGRTVFGRMFDMLQLLSIRANAAQSYSNLPSNVKGNSRIAFDIEESDNNMVEDVRQVLEKFGAPNPNLKVYEFSDLESSTRSFSQDFLLGRGLFGELFLATFDERSLRTSTCGDEVAVLVKRRRSVCSQGNDQCLAELGLLGQLTHPNIVTLLGYCNHGDENMLVYEYKENRCLDNFLFTGATNTAKPLSWGKRLRIMIGVARGLTYLHSLKDQVVCGGVQSSRILLDQDFNAKLLDFGLLKSRLQFGNINYGPSFTTHHILDPEYLRTGHFDMKSDIYGFGVVLLETLTALPAIGSESPDDEQYSLVDWAHQILANRQNLEEIMDPCLEQNYPLDGAFECGQLALRCVSNKAKDRPSSEELLQSLEQIYTSSKQWRYSLRETDT
uniref:protein BRASSINOSTEROID INSENSITIVE 1-like n=1 Tax=Erigeron canadensis TaxID=72917 RepID=UPI001CB88CD0|nr:protein BRASSINOSTEROID INSENSITIVE 1-like [Erigeron canadensis]